MGPHSEDGLLKYLESERQGGSVQSEGNFRVDWQKARQKTRDFAFEKPHQWICRLLQALTLLESQALEVIQGRVTLHFQTELAQPLPPPEQFLSPRENSGLQALLDAVWGAEKRQLDVSLGWTDSASRTWRMELEDGHVKVSAQEKPLKRVHLRVVTRSFISKVAALFRKAQFLAEFRELTKACRTLAFPVTIDSRPYVPVESEPMTFPLRVARHRVSELGFPLHNRYLQREFEHWPNKAPWPNQKADILVLMRYVETPRPIEYYWVIDGLPIPIEAGRGTGGPSEVTSCVQTQIYISAGDLKTDLSGLKVIEGRKRASILLNQALRLIAEDPPLALAEQLFHRNFLGSLMTCFNAVVGQCESIIRQSCLGDTSGSFYRESLMKEVRKRAESRIESLGSGKIPSGFWDKIRQSTGNEAE